MLATLALTTTLARTVAANALPDGRAYELVTPLDKNASQPSGVRPSISGDRVNWVSLGALGDANTGLFNLYQSQRTDQGWQTTGLTPRLLMPALTLLEIQNPVFTSPDGSQTIFQTGQPYAAGDNDTGATDLYLLGPEGKLTWISQGSQGGTDPIDVTFDGATPDVSHVVFSTEESLTANAVGLEVGPAYQAIDYLYVRDVPEEKTTLVNVEDAGNVIDAEGAILGNGRTLATGGPPTVTFESVDSNGSTTHAISKDGSKIFFETPPPGNLGGNPTHLYMRENNSQTVAIDDPQSTGSAQYEGASEDGSLVFFTSNEGLAGDSFTDKELYEFDTTTDKLTHISAGAGGNADGAVIGETAISNDGSHVYFAARGVLASNPNARGQLAAEGQPNFYVYDTRTGTTTFIATLALQDVEAEPGTGPLTQEPDIGRVAQTTPDGSVLVFESSADLTDENPTEFFEVYRYNASSGALTCISCLPGGAAPISHAFIAIGGGGSYDPPGGALTMNEDGSRIFFETPDALVPEDINSQLMHTPRSDMDIYEWENGKVALISGGTGSFPSLLGSTTPKGDDIFFITIDRLVPQDTDGGEVNIYDARVDGGFAPTVPPTPCSGSDCRQAPPPPSFATPGSLLLQEVSNLIAAIQPKATKQSTSHKVKGHKAKRRKVKRHKAKRQRKTKGKTRHTAKHASEAGSRTARGITRTGAHA